MKCHSYSFSSAIAVILLSALTYGQADQHNHQAAAAQQPAAQPAGQAPAANKTPKPKTEAQLSFDAIKTLAGEWEGAIETDFPGAKEALEKSGGLHVTMRVTSRGNVLVHEFQEIGTLLDPTKYDHPVTMIYLDQDQLNLVHYCDAGNRPKMTGKMAPDGKTLAFDFTELSGSDRFGHMQRGVFTLVDKDHHIEEWTFMLKGKDGVARPIQAKFNLKRVNGPMAGAGPSGGAQ
jgi:hypothetical protein